MSTNAHLHRFWKMECAPLLMERKLFPNIKEVTESVAAFVAIQQHIGVGRGLDNVDVIVVGDGHTPRTAALIACLTKWNCHSIDPVMREKEWGIKRLATYRSKMEDHVFVGTSEETAIIVMVHSHAPVKSAWDNVRGYGQKHLVNIPCCFKADMDFPPRMVYNDDGIHSPHNEISIWSTR